MPKALKKDNRNKRDRALTAHRLNNMAQMMVHLIDRVETLHAICLASDEERAIMRQQVMEANNERPEESGEQNNQVGNDSGSDLEGSGRDQAEE